MCKSHAFVTGLALVAAFGGLSFIFPGRAGSLGIILGAVATLTSAYIGLQVANNGVKGKFWNQAMHDAENPQEAMR
jgi:hypothetical protein